MKESVSKGTLVTPILFPYELEQYWQQVRQIIREEVSNIEKQKPVSPLTKRQVLPTNPCIRLPKSAPCSMLPSQLSLYCC
jgi:hypothetical protein